MTGITKVKTIFTNPAWMYEIGISTDNRMFMKVVCGSIGMYDVVVELNDMEISEFRKSGNIDEIAKSFMGGDRVNRHLDTAKYQFVK